MPGSRFGVTALLLQPSLGEMLPAARALPCSFGKVSGLAWCIPYIIHGTASLALGLQPDPRHRPRGVRGRQEQLRRAARGRSRRPSAMPSGRAPGATHGHVPRQTRAQVNTRAGRCAGSRILPAPGIPSPRPAGAGA